MILESLFSCSCLLLTCGSCVYTLVKHSYAQYHKLLLHFTYACGGIAMISTRSLFVLLYKLFFKQYPFDPVMIELEEERAKGKYNTVDELLRTLGMASLIYSVYCHHGYYFLGACIVAGLSVLDMLELRKYLVGNNYALLANYPYLFTNWAFTPEGFYQGWTIRYTINDYMMAAYIACMIEALRQTPLS
ncbi:uncharacterized protein LOC143185076 [Calliopsis andreniformis]|uniref:uncharacterized protein LOC143185076 n=1 Tax=Calliopsis andreniformis TaxID=337506 RepID=UPI003FCE643B